jgi:hypothetical protein
MYADGLSGVNVCQLHLWHLTNAPAGRLVEHPVQLQGGRLTEKNLGVNQEKTDKIEAELASYVEAQRAGEVAWEIEGLEEEKMEEDKEDKEDDFLSDAKQPLVSLQARQLTLGPWEGASREGWARADMQAPLTEATLLWRLPTRVRWAKKRVFLAEQWGQWHAATPNSASCVAPSASPSFSHRWRLPVCVPPGGMQLSAAVFERQGDGKVRPLLGTPGATKVPASMCRR